MKYNMNFLIVVLISSFFIQKAQAQLHSPNYSAPSADNFLIAPSLLYYTGLRSRTSKDEKSYLVGDLKLAYQVSSNIYVGATYQLEKEEVVTSGYSSPSFNNSSESQRKSLGASVGYVTSTFHFIFTYFVDSKWQLDTVSSTGSNKYDYKGSGLQIDLGYKIPLWGFFLGPQITYKMFSYDELVTNGGSSANISPKLEDKKLEPSLVFNYFF